MGDILFSVTLSHCLFADVEEVGFCAKCKLVPTSNQRVIDH